MFTRWFVLSLVNKSRLPIFCSLCALTCLLGMWANVAVAQDTAWRAGLAKREITPQDRVHLAGYASRNRPFESVRDPLFVKALALEDAEQNRCLLITCDILGYREEFTAPIYERIAASTGIHPPQVLLNASHTHSGPILSLDPEFRANEMTDEQAAATRAYTQRLMDLTVEAAEEAVANLAPAKISYGLGVTHFVMNRREHIADGVRLGFHPRGYVDRGVPLLRIDDAAGTLRGVVFGAACHNTTLGGDSYVVSGDYAGDAQQWIESQHPGTQAMFVMGCGGSANPHPRGTVEHVKQHGEALGREVCRLLDEKLTPLSGNIACAGDRATLPLQAALSRDVIQRWADGGGWQQFVGQRMLERLDRGESLPAELSCPITVWKLGDRLTLVGLSGEVVGEYVPLLERTLGPRDLWVAAYCHDVFGYVPTRQVLAEGGYETRGVIYRGIGLFAPEVEEALLDAVRKLARKVGRE